jgi:hypothetical protein
MTAADMIAAGRELKGQWKMIHAEAQKMAKTYAPKKATKKNPARKTAKKARV